jgi:lipoate-protein ligase A
MIEKKIKENFICFIYRSLDGVGNPRVSNPKLLSFVFMLRCIKRTETDPYYNLAAEECLLKSSVNNTFMTWRNEPSVVIGKHQNALREINHDYVNSMNLPVIRRISGGGTVYHDPGNINFSFIYTDRKENLVDFRYFTEPIISFLQSCGLEATFEGKSNIAVNGLKVSGNSAHIFRQKILHHGTLLFNTDLDALEKAISGRDEQYNDKSVRSVRAKVANISNLLEKKMSAEEFTAKFNSFIFNRFSGSYIDELISSERESIKKLAKEKYRDYNWNYGYSPEYEYNEEWAVKGENYSILLSVKGGIIMKSEIKVPGLDSFLLKAIADQLTGTMHEKKSILERLKKLNFVNDYEEQVLNQIIQHLF